MTKPEDVSEGAWDAAGKAMGSPSFTPETVRIRVARAIMAAEQREREACAQVVEAQTKASGMTTVKERWIENVGLRAAAAILNRGENQGD